MKKVLYSFGMIALIASTIMSFQSCDKIKDEIASHLDAITWTQADMTFEVPIVTTTDPYGVYDSIAININDIIAQNGGSGFSIDNFSAINIKDITLHLDNADASTNWTNFSSASVLMSTDKSNAQNLMAVGDNYTIDDNASEQYSDKVLTPDGINLKDYFYGGETKVYYFVAAVARRATTHPVTMHVKVRYELVP